MACKYKYNGKWFTENELIYLIGEKKNLLDISNKQALERLDSLQEIFKQVPQLQEVGTIFDYDLYLDTIFPDSKVKLPSTGETMIVYHGTNAKFDTFSKELFGKETIGYLKSKGFWFTHFIEEAENYGNNVMPALLNLKNPYIKQLSPTQSEFANQVTDIQHALENNFDGAILDIDEGVERSQGVTEYVAFEPEQIHILGSKQDIEGFKSWVDNNQSNVQYQLPQDREQEEFVASEKTIRDLAARMSNFDLFQNADNSSPFEKLTYSEQQKLTKKIKRISEKQGARIGVRNYDVYDSLIKNEKHKEAAEYKKNSLYLYKIINNKDEKYRGVTRVSDGIIYINLAYATLDTPIHEILGHPIIRAIKTGNRQLYQNLLKELEYGKGKEVFDRIKRDYKYKELSYQYKDEKKIRFNDYLAFKEYTKGAEDNKDVKIIENKYTLEKQQEEAIVELLGLYTAGKLDKVKDGKLISLLKRLLKEVKAFMRSLLNQREVEIDKLPDNMTLGDIADLLAYSNSKLILPGNEVVYTTPDNQQFKTYQEASNHISDLAKSVEDVDLSDINLDNFDNTSKRDLIKYTLKDLDKIDSFFSSTNGYEYKKDKNGDWFIIDESDTEYQYFNGKFPEVAVHFNDVLYEYNATDYMDNKEESYPLTKKEFFNLLYTKSAGDTFIENNKQYEQSKEIIEEWKKVNNIQYNPEEVYSRGQEFVSVVGAYSNFDVNLMMQNLLQHIEDNQKAGGEFTISAFTKPVDRKIGHLEGGGGKIKFKIYPQSQDIKWAANSDVHSGSVWDASEKVNKDKKSELLGVSYTKYPSLQNVNKVQPNLAAIIDNLAYQHNELGISLTGNNFRLEYDEDIPYTTKKIIDSINSILDQKYGKIVKPESNKINTIPDTFEYWQQDMNEDGGIDRFRIQVYKKNNKWFEEFFNTYGESESVREITYKEVEDQFNEALISNSTLTRNKGIQPTQTNETLKESIESVTASVLQDKKEYTEQALINTKIAKLKEVVKKYPRSLIRSEVRPIPRYEIGDEYYEPFKDELPFQKVSDSSFQQFQQSLNNPNTNPTLQGNQEAVITPNDNQELLYKLNDIFEDRTSLIFNINNNKDFDTNSRLKAIRSLIDNKEVNYNNHLEHLEEYLELFEHLPAIHNLINKYGSKQAILEVYDNDNGSGNNNLQQEFIEAVNGLKSIFRNVNKTKLNSLENWLDKNIVDINKIDIQDKDDNVLYPTEQYSLDVNNEKFIKYYYELSGKKEDIITFAKRLKSTIATYKLLGYNNDKILEMLKCL